MYLREGLPQPNEPGWWAFEGKFNEPDAKEYRYVFEVLYTKGMDIDVEADTLVIAHCYNYEYPANYIGTWNKLNLPWEVKDDAR